MSLKNISFSFLQNYQIHKKLPYSDETVLINKDTQHFLLMKQILPENTLQLKQVIQSLQTQRSTKNTHLLQLIDYQTQSYIKQNISYHKVIVFYQYSGHNLLEQVNSRIKTNKMFDENELWNILCSIVLGLAHLQKSDIGHGCVSLLDIFLTSDGALKIVDPSITSVIPSDFTQGYYYSPEMFEFFANPRIQPEDIDIYRSDVFSLALCMLHVATLDQLDTCMDYDNYCLDFDELQHKICTVNEYYSQDFVNVLVWMLSENANDRPDFLELQQYLVNAINERDEIFRGNDITLSMQYQYLTQSKRSENYQQILEPFEPERQDTSNQLTCIPCVIFDIQHFDINNHTEVKSSLKICQESKQSQIIITQSISFHNTQRSNIEKKQLQEIEAIVFKKVSNKQNQKPRQSLISDIGMMVKSSKDNISLIDNLFPTGQINKNNEPITVLAKFQEKQNKDEIKKPNPIASKGIARKWNVVKQPAKHDIKSKTIAQTERQNQRVKVNSEISKPKKVTVAPQNKVIKRVKPAVKSPRPVGGISQK